MALRPDPYQRQSCGDKGSLRLKESWINTRSWARSPVGDGIWIIWTHINKLQCAVGPLLVVSKALLCDGVRGHRVLLVILQIHNRRIWEVYRWPRLCVAVFYAWTILNALHKDSYDKIHDKHDIDTTSTVQFNRYYTWIYFIAKNNNIYIEYLETFLQNNIRYTVFIGITKQLLCNNKTFVEKGITLTSYTFENTSWIYIP